MIVDCDTLNVKPIADELIREETGSYVAEVSRGEIAWSNELVMHLIELKTDGPAESLAHLHEQFQAEVQEVNQRLEKHHAKLMPAAMHPWMDPYTEMKLWPHEYNPIYERYNRIFDCRGHGWANLQSTHINLPFASDREFEKLHAAIRVVLPLLPAIAASSPLADGRYQNFADYRLEVYRTNSKRIPSVTGYIIPEAVFSRQEYDRQIFQRMYRDIAPFDPDRILQDEWLNSRGAIARFDRGSIEIRLLDIQECPRADLAIVRLVCDTVRALAEERWSSTEEQKKWNEKPLYGLLLKVMRDGENAILESAPYSRLFDGASARSAGDLWQQIFKRLYTGSQTEADPVLQTMQELLEIGTLSSRLRASIGKNADKQNIFRVYNQLCNCLQEGSLFK